MVKVLLERIKLPTFIFFMMMATDSALVTINNDRFFARIAWVLLLGGFLFFLLKNKRCRSVALCFIMFFSLSLLVTMLIEDTEGAINYFQRIVILFLAFFVVQEFEYTEFMDAFVKLMRFVCIISLIGVALHDIICGANVFPRFYSGEFAYECLLFTNLPHYSMRNFGPLWEPGAFQIYINLALLYEVRYNSKIRMRDILLYSLTVLTTRSTSGIIILALIFVYFLMSKGDCFEKKHLRKIKICMFFVGILGVFALLNTSDFITQIFGKIAAFFENNDSMNSANVSAYVRFKGIFANIELFLEKPLFGWGINGVTDAFDNRYGFTTNTCTVLAVASTYGLLPFLMYNFLWIRAVLQEKKKRDGVIFGIVILIILSTENMLVSLLFWIMLIYESNILRSKTSISEGKQRS